MSVETLTLPGIAAFITNVDSAFLNVVIDTRDNAFNSSMIDTVENFFNRHSVPWVWLMTPSIKENNLNENGFSLLEEFPGMYFHRLRDDFYIYCHSVCVYVDRIDD